MSIDKKPNKEITGSEQELDALFKSDVNDSPASTERVKNIMKSARQEAGMRDLLTHMLFRIWIPILSIGSIVFVFFNGSKKTKK